MLDLSKRLVIAEIGMTHDGSVGQAMALIRAAADAGVDAIKLQLHISRAETIRNAPQPPYFHGEPRYEFFERTAFSLEQWKQIKQLCLELGVFFIVSPFSIEATEMIMDLGVDAIKIPSGEITNIPYLEHMSKYKIPILISSGMSTWEELYECVQIFKRRKCQFALMQCTSEYPCKPENIGFNMISVIQKQFPNTPVGFSDHTEGIWADVAAWMMGANIIEKHFTLSKLMYGPDARMSLEPSEMRQLCDAIKKLQIALENPVYKNDLSGMSDMKKIFQKSIVAATNIPKGTIIQENMLAYKKPGTGLETKYYREIIGKKTTKTLGYDEIMQYEDIEWTEER